LPLDTLPDENSNTPLAPMVPVVAVPSPKPKNKAPTLLTSLPPAMASMLLPAPLVLLPTVKEINQTRRGLPWLHPAPTMLSSLPPAMASMLLPAPLVLLPTVGEIDLPRPSMASPVPSHTAPMLPLDALPDENPNTPLAPVVPVVAVPSPKPKDKAPTMLTSLPPAMASMLLPAPLVLLPTVKEIDPPRPSVAAPVPSRRCCRSTRCPMKTPTRRWRP
jgi:hypothetical protein